jgi:hypothetical protein
VPIGYFAQRERPIEERGAFVGTSFCGLAMSKDTMTDHGRVMRCISFTAQVRGELAAVAARVYPLVCGVIRADL